MQLRSEEIYFPGSRTARLVRLGAGALATDAIRALGIQPPKLVLLLMGGADNIEPERQPYIQNVISEGIIRAACEADAVVIDGGTASGIMAMAGQAAAAVGNGQLTLIGVAPGAKVTWPNRPDPPEGAGLAGLDPNHSHFVITPGEEWGGELDTLFALADALHESAGVIAILINGGEGAQLELVQCRRRRWPILVLQGTGRLADSIADSQSSGGSNIRDGLQIIKPELPRAELRRLIVRGNLT